MTVQLIGVGSQARLRQVLQTNMDTLKEELNLLGIQTPAMPVVADTQQRLQQQVAEALSAGRSVIIVGGIGEGDDLTVATVCKGLGAQVTEDHLSYNTIAARYKALGRSVPNGVRSGVRVPTGATVFRSRTGGYPGSAVSSGRQCIVMLPDDPAELRALLDTTVFTYLSELAGQPAVRHRVGVSGLAASQVTQLLEDMTGRRNPTLSVTAGAGEVLVRVTSLGQNLGEAAALGTTAVDTVKARLGSCVYGVDVDGLAPVLAAQLKEKNIRVAVAEAETDRWTTALLDRYQVVAADADVTGTKGKEALGLTAKQVKTLSGQDMAVVLADALRRQSGAALGMAVLAEGQEEGRQVICLALTDRKHAWTRRLAVNSTNTAFVRSVAANQVMNMARLYLGHYNDILAGAKELKELTGAAAGNKKAAGAGLLTKLKKDKGSDKNKHSRKAAQEESGMKQANSAKAAWWTRFIPVKGDDKREIIRKCIFWLAIIVFICSIAYILSVKQESVNNEKLTQELGNLLVDETYVIDDGYPEDYLTKFAALWERNEDISGWIEIAGTQLNYPVVQAKNNTKYDRTDFDGKANDHGVPFVDYRVDIKKPSTNTVIYAHNMNDGQMFGELMNYKKLAYYKEHPTFRYDTVYKENTYKILGVFLVTANDPEFLYHNMINLDEAQMTEFVNQVRARSLINTKIDVNTADKLVTLSTCDYSFKDAQGNRVARFVVVGRAVRQGEDPNVDTSVATLNANPVMPTEWYEQIKRNQEAAELAAAEAALQEALKSVDPSNYKAWLTAEEIEALLAEGYSEDDLIYFAEERRYELLNWLTEEELSGLTAEEKLAEMYGRRDRKWLSEDDRKNLAEEDKTAKAQSNQSLAAQWLTEEEIKECRTWREIEELIAKKQAEKAEAEASQSAAAEERKNNAVAKMSEYGLNGLAAESYNKCLEALINGKDSDWDKICQKYKEEMEAAQAAAQKAKEEDAKKRLENLNLTDYDACLKEMLKADKSKWKDIISKYTAQSSSQPESSSGSSSTTPPEDSSSSEVTPEESSSATTPPEDSSEEEPEPSEPASSSEDPEGGEEEGGEQAASEEDPQVVLEEQDNGDSSDGE